MHIGLTCRLLPCFFDHPSKNPRPSLFQFRSLPHDHARLDATKLRIAQAGAVGPLLRLATSYDRRVQRAAAAALLTLTHVGVFSGVCPFLIGQESSSATL